MVNMQRILIRLVASFCLLLSGLFPAIRYWTSGFQPFGQLAPTNTPTSLPINPSTFTVRIHPDGSLFVGDQVSFEIFSSPGIDLTHQSVSIQVSDPGKAQLGPAEFKPANDGKFLAALTWAWNTQGLGTGRYTLTFKTFPGNVEWSQQVTLLPESERPPPENQSHWATVQTTLCIIHYLTGTAAERDLPELEKMADAQASQVAAAFHTTLTQPVLINFLPRVLGHGGFTSDEIYVSYLDRNYAGSTTEMVLHHEMVHLVDGRLGGDLRPTMLVEGLAVYMSGGHFKKEPVVLQAAAMLRMNWYLPLANLADNFYPAQHELGYWEAAAWIDYLVQTYGWDAYSAFYRDIHPQQNGSQSQAIDSALRKHFGLSFQQVEDHFLDFLHAQPAPPDIQLDVAETVHYYNTVRRYQQVLDPSAYFRQLWMPNANEMRKRNITADYLRHPDSPENQALETLLVATDQALRSGDYASAEHSLSAVDAVLDKGGGSTAFAVDATAADALEVSRVMDRCGIEPQQIMFNSDDAGQAIGISAWPQEEAVPFSQSGGSWRLNVPCSVNPLP